MANPNYLDLTDPADLTFEERQSVENEEVIKDSVPEETVPQPPPQQPQLPIDPTQLQQGIQNVQAGIPGAWENAQIQAGAFLKGRSVEEEAAWREEEKAKWAEKTARVQAEIDSRTDPLSEGIRAAIGGGADAVESVGSFAELTGDTLKTGINSLFGKPIDPTQNPFDDSYIKRDGNWLNIPDEWVPENKTGIGQFSRGLVEFGLLTRWTGAVGGTVTGGAARSANAATAGNRWINFAGKSAKIFAEGSVAELISSSSEAGNIANLAQEHVPWLAPTIMNALAVRPEDNPWVARLRTVTAGGGMNHVAHFVGAFGKGLWKAQRHIQTNKAAKRTITQEILDEADELANKEFQQEMAKEIELDEFTATEMAALEYVEGRGIGRADPRDEYLREFLSEEDYIKYNDPNTGASDRQLLEGLADKQGAAANNVWDPINYQSQADAGRQPSPHVNPELYNTSEKAAYRSSPDPVKTHVRQAVIDAKTGGEGKSYSPIASEPQIRAISRGNKSYRQYVQEVLDDISDMAFKDLDNRLDYAEIKSLILRQARPMLDLIDEFSDGKRINLAKAFKKAMDDPDNYRVYMDDGTKITTTSPALKGANVLVLHSLAQTVSDLATGAVRVSDDLSISHQAASVFDAMKVLLTENKKMGMMWGLDGKAQQYGFKLSPAMKKAKEIDLQKISAEMEEYFDTLMRLADDPTRHKELKSLMELHALSQGKVRTLDHIHEFLRAKKWGGRMDDMHIRGMVRQQARGVMFNSILGAPRTIVKALAGTNTIAFLRPFQAYLGSSIGRNFHGYIDEKQMAIAAVQIDSMWRSWKESLQMAQRNWELGVKRKNQDYQGKFDLEADMREWKSLKKYYEQFGTPAEQNGYAFIDKIVDFNTNPWIKYSQNAMGAGDAFARTLIGRQMMAKKAAIDAIEKGVNLNDLKKYVAETEEGFRKEIFDKNKDGFDIVKDKAAAMAGDETAMTKALEQNFRGFELISEIPVMKSFFPFVRTGFNYLDVTLVQASPAQIFRDKYKDLVWHKKPRNLDKYGLKPEEVAQEVALMEGRVAMGTAVIGLGVIAALTGRSYGDLPPSKTDRDLWKLNKIEPHSFKLGDGTYFNHSSLEVFSPLFSLTANVVSNADILGEKLTDEWLSKAVWLASATIIDQSMLSGIGDLAALLEPESVEGRAGYSLSRIARARLPWAAISGTLGDILHHTRREANTLMELIVRRDVLLQNAVPPKYDILNKDRSGKVLHYGADNVLLRIFNKASLVPIVPVDGDPIRQNLLEIRYNIPDAYGTYKGEELNSREQSLMQKYLSMGPLREYLEEVMASNAYKESLQAYKDRGLKITDGASLKDAQFYYLVHQAFRKAKDQAWLELMTNHPELAERVERRAQKKQLLQQGQYEQLDHLINYATNP